MRDLTTIPFKPRTSGPDGGAWDLVNPYGGGDLFVVASFGFGWDHVSVSLKKRTPNWRELEFVRKLFFKPDEVVMQLHVPEGRHVNMHANCLHLWRPQDQEIPRPPGWMVGVVGIELPLTY